LLIRHTSHSHSRARMHRNIGANSIIKFFTSALDTEETIETELRQLSKMKQSIDSQRGDLVKADNFVKKLEITATPTK